MARQFASVHKHSFSRLLRSRYGCTFARARKWNPNTTTFFRAPVFRACPPLKAPIRIVPFPFVIFFRPKFTRHTHTHTQLVPSFDCHNTAVSSPLFLLLSTANSLRFQLQTLVRPFLIIFQLPSPVFVYHSPLPSQDRDNFSPLSLSRFRTLGKFSRRYAGRNAEETFHRSIVRPRGSQFRRIQESRREKKGERTKLNL